MRSRIACLIVLIASCLAGCDQEFRPIWHSVTLASGAVVKVTSMNLVWGVEHDSRDERQDCFALEFVSAIADSDEPARQRELSDVFELVRPASETWGFNSASIARFPTIERKGHYDFFLYTRAANGSWSYERSARKVFSTD